MKVLLDVEIRTDKVMPARRPDTAVIDKTKRTTAIINVAVPLSWKIKDKEDLRLEQIGLVVRMSVSCYRG